jgi:hypothetical protein
MSYLSFQEIPNPTRKTKRWGILNQDGSQLGTVVFSVAWRKYIFLPYVDTQFDAGCLDEVSNFLKEQTGLWRNSL